MRPGQQNNNKRMRGRNRKGPNPLTRTFESNGPDVKIRGTALHIAEKYVTLARDAQSSGDRVMAENYLQHAEHYFRVIAAAQVQNPQQQPFFRPDAEDEGLDEEDDRFSERFGQTERLAAAERSAGEGEGQPGSEPQPYVNGNGQYSNGGERQMRGDRQDRQDRPERQERQDRPERHERQDARPPRQDGDRQEARQEGRQEGRPEGRQERFRGNRDDRGPRPERRERSEQPIRSELPRFVTGDTPQPVIETAPLPEPVAEPVPVEIAAVAAAAPEEAPAGGEEEMFRPRRRRASRARTRRTEAGDAEPTLAIDAVDEE